MAGSVKIHADLPAMTQRRALLRLALAAPFLVPPFLAAAAPETPTQTAADFIRAAGNELAGIIDADLPPAEKRRRLAAFLDRVVDIPGVARFCLGRFWRRASAAERTRFVALYHGILLDSVLARVGTYRHPRQQGMQVQIGRAEARDGDIYVPTSVARAGHPAAAVTWVVRIGPSGPQIVDLIAEGTSLRITVRSDYASFLNQHDDSIPALLDAMARQVSTAEAGASGR